jgi:hypothetical protein
MRDVIDFACYLVWFAALLLFASVAFNVVIACVAGPIALACRGLAIVREARHATPSWRLP